jgi:hypothetical protein
MNGQCREDRMGSNMRRRDLIKGLAFLIPLRSLLAEQK